MYTYPKYASSSKFRSGSEVTRRESLPHHLERPKLVRFSGMWMGTPPVAAKATPITIPTNNTTKKPLIVSLLRSSF